MQVEDITVATITWVRNPEDERVLLEALRSLAALESQLFIADGGSSDEYFRDLQRLPNTRAFRAERPGIVAQTRESLKTALKDGTKFLLYTEPDKRHFFEVALREFINALTLRRRSALAFLRGRPRASRRFRPRSSARRRQSMLSSATKSGSGLTSAMGPCFCIEPSFQSLKS